MSDEKYISPNKDQDISRPICAEAICKRWNEREEEEEEGREIWKGGGKKRVIDLIEISSSCEAKKRFGVAPILLAD